MKQFKGKAIYNPSGKAGEYSYWACNFYVGCSNGCEYCYCKKGILAGAMGQDKPQLKKCFKDEIHALNVFESELSFNIVELQKHGLFFSFTTDPMLQVTKDLTLDSLCLCLAYDIPVKILTKCTEWLESFLQMIEDSIHMYNKKNLIAFGFTLTGHDELENGAATNEDRIRAMKVLSNEGFKIFASIEPIIDFRSSFEMIRDTNGFCDLYKIGLKSDGCYSGPYIREFVKGVLKQTEFFGAKVYFKDSLLKQAGITREELPANCVGRDYKLHEANR